MQLCELCTYYETCNLKKREDNDPFAPCTKANGWELLKDISLDRYEALKAQMQNIHQQSLDKQKLPQVVIENDVVIPVEADAFMSAQILPSELFLDFVNCNFSDENSRSQFIQCYQDADQLIFRGAWNPQNEKHNMMLGVQAELTFLINVYSRGLFEFCKQYIETRNPLNPDPIEILNIWLDRVTFRIRPFPVFPDNEIQEKFDTPYRPQKWVVKRNDAGEIISEQKIFNQVEEDTAKEKGLEIVEIDEGAPSLVWRLFRDPGKNVEWSLVPWVLFRPEPTGNYPYGRNPYSLLFLQFATMALKGQELKQCQNPNCKRYFLPAKRKDRGPTCGRGACYTWWSRNKGSMM